MTSIGQINDGRAFKFSRSTTRGFFSAMHSIAEHFRYHLRPAQKMDLKTVRLFGSPGLRVNTFDVRFGIRIGSFSHEFFR